MIQPRVCLISPGHVASNPRLVKEADALESAGFHVRVVAGNYMAAIQPLDQTILSQARWSWVQVGADQKLNYLRQRAIQEAAKKVASTGWMPHLSIATWAHSPVSRQLALAAMAEQADLYIAHCLAALPAAAWAAQKHQARLGFDAEDFHPGELPNIPQNRVEIRVRHHLEQSLLPQCHHLTAASPLIAEAYRNHYGVQMRPILNVFPLSEAPPSPDWQQKIPVEDRMNQRFGPEPSLYWFSQTIGPGRGLETIIRAMGKMQTRVRLHLRGMLATGYESTLRQLAKSVGVNDYLHFLPSAPPAEMVCLAAYHDIGLSLEQTEPLNRAICLTNKIFVYLLAGLPVVMSKTPAQEKLSHQLGEAALVIGDQPAEIATSLDRWLRHPEKLREQQQKAWHSGRETYNWDREKLKFLDVIAQALNLV